MEERQLEDEWCRAHLPELRRRLAGQWFVVEKQELIAHDRDPEKVLHQARAKGVRVPYLLFLHPRYGLEIPD